MLLQQYDVTQGHQCTSILTIIFIHTRLCRDRQTDRLEKKTNWLLILPTNLTGCERRTGRK